MTKFKEIREDRDIKQKEIAKYLGIAQNTYSQYENEKRDMPIEAIKKLCQYYNVSADYLLDLPRNLPYPKRITEK